MRNCYFYPATKAIADCNELDEGIVIISRINVPEQYRGLGLGSMLLNRICREADRDGKVLELWLNPTNFSDKGLPKDQLAAWYVRYGFDFEGPMLMRRHPHSGPVPNTSTQVSQA